MQTPPVAPKAPAAPAAPGTAVATPAPVAEVATPSLDFLRARGRELSNQLNSAASRRQGLLRELTNAPPGAMNGINQRLEVLDSRLVQLEKDIAQNGQLLAQARGQENSLGFTTGTGAPITSFGGLAARDVTAISVVFTIFVLFPIALAAARLLWKRGNRPVVPGSVRESELRMERVEQAVDTIAVEIERISEGQRFVTQLLTRPQPQALPVGQAPAEPLRVPLSETVMNIPARKNVAG